METSQISYDDKIFDVLKLEALLEKLMVTQLVKISSRLNGTRSFINVFV
jgi:hypothetical protein